jgi:hypothetical protein
LTDGARIDLPIGRRFVSRLRLSDTDARTIKVGRHCSQQRDADGVEARSLNHYAEKQNKNENQRGFSFQQVAHVSD